ncbi:MAG: dihydrodipicolinate synthase family protein [Niabella sp.]
MKNKKYTGIIVPAITPLTKSLQIDIAGVEKLFSLLYNHQAVPFILGTTGEAASLSIQLKKNYIVAAAANKKPDTLLYAGISSNVLEESIEMADFCALHQVDAVVATLPSYYALTDTQMLEYFVRLADSISLPLFIYNIPATTHMSIPINIVEELSRHKNIVGVKDSERNEDRMKACLKISKDRNDFHYILGWAAKSAEALLLGADGLVPSTGNLYPDIYKKMLEAHTSGDEKTMYDMQKLSDTYGATYQKDRTLGESLYALKLFMNEKNICEPFVMPPL